MINSLLCAKVIFNSLANDENIKTAVGNRIYPIVADNNAKFPFIVYKRTSISSNDCKDGYWADDVQFEVVVVSDKYSEGLSIANDVRKVLNKRRLSTDDLAINDVNIISATENFIDNSYVQNLTFTTKIYNE